MSTPVAQLLCDLNQWFGSDLTTSPQGDIATVTGTIRGQQRVLRRLMTNPGSYIWEPTYGAGLPQWVGRIIDVPKVQALCVAQMLLESVVAPSPPPTATVTQSVSDLTQFDVLAGYFDAPTSTPVILSFTVS